jgi:hypothetical protein
MPNKSGIAANGISFFVFVFLSVATPTPESTTPAVKLAVAEKHIMALVYHRKALSKISQTPR